MDFSASIINEYREKADRRMALSSRLMIGLMLLVALLNLMGVFKISPIPLYTTVLISIVDFFLPTLFYDIL